MSCISHGLHRFVVDLFNLNFPEHLSLKFLTLKLRKIVHFIYFKESLIDFEVLTDIKDEMKEIKDEIKEFKYEFDFENEIENN